MTLLLPYGYSIEADELADLLDIETFNEMTAGKFASDSRAVSMIAAAQSAIRDWCGWHIFPSLACTFSEPVLRLNQRVKAVDGDLLVQLPATYVTEVSGVSVGGVSTSDFVCTPNGLLTVFGAGCVSKRTIVSVSYVAGLPDVLMDGLRELAMHRVDHALSQSHGVQSEAAGGVSITYNATWANNARATALPDDNKAVLAPYKVMEVV